MAPHQNEILMWGHRDTARSAARCGNVTILLAGNVERQSAKQEWLPPRELGARPLHASQPSGLQACMFSVGSQACMEFVSVLHALLLGAAQSAY